MSFSIVGTGSCMPDCIKTNDQLPIDSSDEWIRSRTGIEQRYICNEQSVTDIATEAAKRALGNGGVDPTELDLIICATISADYITPSMACLVQQRIGASCPAFDINVACTGFVYALDIAASYFAAGRAQKILVVAAEAMSRIVDWNDRSTCILFGDGAGAVVLSKGDDLLAITLTANGDMGPLKGENLAGNCPFTLNKQSYPYLQMNGQDVFKFAVSSMCRDVEKVMNDAKLSYEDVDYILTHQANMRIIQAAQGRLPIDKEKFRTNIDKCANTSSASIPILLDQLNQEGSFKSGDVLVMSAFGSGLATGACVLRWK